MPPQPGRKVQQEGTDYRTGSGSIVLLTAREPISQRRSSDTLAIRVDFLVMPLTAERFLKCASHFFTFLVESRLTPEIRAAGDGVIDNCWAANRRVL